MQLTYNYFHGAKRAAFLPFLLSVEQSWESLAPVSADDWCVMFVLSEQQ